METNAALVQHHQRRPGTDFLWSRVDDVRQENNRLRQHSQALQARYHHWRQRSVLVECAWCQQHIRWQWRPDPLPVPMTSHGICPSCYTTVTRELGLMSHQMPLTG